MSEPVQEPADPAPAGPRRLDRRRMLRRSAKLVLGTVALEATNRWVFELREPPRVRYLGDCPKPYVRSCFQPHDQGLINGLGYWEREWAPDPGTRTVVVTGASATLLPRHRDGVRNDFPHLADLILNPAVSPDEQAREREPARLPPDLRAPTTRPTRIYNFAVNGWSLHEIASIARNELVTLRPDVWIVSEPTNTVTARRYRNPSGIRREVSRLPGFELLTFVGVLPSSIRRAEKLRHARPAMRVYGDVPPAPRDLLGEELALLDDVLASAARAGAFLLIGNHPDALRVPAPGETEIGHRIGERFVVLGERPWASYWSIKRGFTSATAAFVEAKRRAGARIGLIDWESALDGYVYFRGVHARADESGRLRLILGCAPAGFAVEDDGRITRGGGELRLVRGQSTQPLTGRRYQPDRVIADDGEPVATIHFEDPVTGAPLLDDARNGTKDRLFHDAYHVNETGARIMAVLTAQALAKLDRDSTI